MSIASLLFYTSAEADVHVKFWKREIDRVLAFQDVICGPDASNISSHDWETLMEAADRASELDMIRKLFFPNQMDYESGMLIGQLLHLDSKWFTRWSLPKLEEEYSDGSCKVYTRRPGFLTKLSDQSYFQVFRNIKENPGTTCASWYVLDSRLSGWNDRH